MNIEGLNIAIGADLSPLTKGLAAASDALAALGEPALEAARLMDEAFTATFGNFTSALENAILKGKFSFSGLVDSILADLTRIAVENLVTKPLGNFLDGIFGALFSFGGGRALGGPVSPGTAYWVGERGPELFMPSGHGAIVPGGGAGASRTPIVMNIRTNNAESFLRSESQVAAMMSRALSRGSRNL
ncbi:MAG: phage tail tape measure protein [Alphaproteobacteria bacterium]|nr:phage tail tape measure protein [Alphaproteobacteria bacterium]